MASLDDCREEFDVMLRDRMSTACRTEEYQSARCAGIMESVALVEEVLERSRQSADCPPEMVALLASLASMLCELAPPPR